MIHNNANLGFHPGSGSQRPVIEHCISRGNSQGIFFCWGVSDGIVEHCELSDNLDYSITIGHRDTDNSIRNCMIERNARAGIVFRYEGTRFLAGHRNTIESCLINDNGHAESGIGIDMRKEPYDVIIRDNRIGDSGSGRQKVGIRIETGVRREKIEGNSFEGLEVDVLDERA